MKPQCSHGAASAPPTILFFDHTAKYGGGEIALYHVLTHLNTARFMPLVVLGEEGALADKLRQAGIETCVIPLPTYVANTRKDSLGAGSLFKLRAIGASIAYAFRLARFVKSRGVSILHTNSLKADIIGGIAAKLARIPVVWHVRDRIESDYLPAFVVSAFRWLCRIIPDFVVTNSAATLSTVRLPGWSQHAVVHSGYASMNGSSAVVHEGVVRRAAAVKTDPDKVLIGLVGRISRWKGQHIFLEAAAQIRKKFPSAQFQIIGSAMFGEEDYEREIREHARAIGIENHVEFMGFRPDVAQLMQEFDILVHASVTGEPFGQVIIEAMAIAKPVVATCGGGVPEIVIDGLTGLLIPMGNSEAMANAVCQLLADPVSARLMGLAGRERALANFTVDQTARRLEDVFERVLQKTSKNGGASLGACCELAGKPA